MRRDDVEILRGIQKNTKMAMKAIDTLGDKVYDDDMAVLLSRQNLKYSEFYNKVTNKLLDKNVEGYRENALNNAMLVGAIKTNTLLNTSTGHLAEMMIQGSNRGIVDMCKTINHNENASNTYVEFAKELMDFEEKNIEQLKKYL